MVKVRNKRTGEIIDISTNEGKKEPFLPGANRVAALIEERGTSTPGILSGLSGFTAGREAVQEIEDVLSDRVGIGKITVPGAVIAGKVLSGVGDLLSRLEASVANPALEIQKNIPIGDLLTGLAGAKGAPIQNLLKESFEGISGKKRGELGDLVRTTGFGGPANEFIASVAGMGSFMGLTNIASRGAIVSGARDAQRAATRIAKRQAVKTARRDLKFFKNKAEEFTNGVSKSFKGMNAEFDKFYNKFGNNPVVGDDAVDLQDIAARLPDTIVNKLKKLSDVKGQVRNMNQHRTVLSKNANTAKIIKTEIGRAVPQKVWSGLERATEAEAKLIQDYHKINDILARTVDYGIPEAIAKDLAKSGKLPSAEFLRLNARMSSLHDFTGRILPKLKTARGTTKTNVLRTAKQRALKGSDQGTLEDFTKFSNKFFKEGRTILEDIDRFNRIRTLKDVAKKIAIGTTAVAGGTALLNRFVANPIKDAVGGPSNFGGGEQ